MDVPGISLLAMLQGIFLSSSDGYAIISCSGTGHAKRRFLAQWTSVIVTNKSPEEIVSMDYFNEKLLESDHGGKVIV